MKISLLTKSHKRNHSIPLFRSWGSVNSVNWQNYSSPHQKFRWTSDCRNFCWVSFLWPKRLVDLLNFGKNALLVEMEWQMDVNFSEITSSNPDPILNRFLSKILWYWKTRWVLTSRTFSLKNLNTIASHTHTHTHLCGLPETALKLQYRIKTIFCATHFHLVIELIEKKNFDETVNIPMM